MSFPPITLPALDPAGPVDPDNDLLLIRQGLNDRKIPAGQIGNLRLGDLTMLPNSLLASDVILVGRSNIGGYDNFIMPPQYLGFLNGTSAWFYQATAPLGWTITPNSGDRVLACSDSVNKYNSTNAPGQTGTWQQPGHTLTINQIPSHSHSALARDSGQSSITRLGRGSTSSTPQNFTFLEGTVIGNTGGGQSHNHGTTWRPLANVGILCQKSLLIGS